MAPQVTQTAKQEIQAVNSTIQGLKDYQGKSWAIGLNGDTLAPDGFLSFFLNRSLPFTYYVRAKGVSLGEPSAYQANIDVLTQYQTRVRSDEKAAVEATIAEMRTYQSKNWAIGLNGTTLQPDGFINFFGTRSIPFLYYVRSGSVSLGEPSAYDNNIKTLQAYMAEL